MLTEQYPYIYNIMPIVKAYDKTEVRLGGGIFLPKDVSQILGLPYSKVRYWIFEFWDNRFGKGISTYSFGDKGNKAIDFHTLIEFYIFYQLRSKGISAQKIQKVHTQLSKELNTRYPFAHTKISTNGKGVWYELVGNLIQVNGKQQFDLKGILEPFLKKIEFGKDNVAEKYYPLNKSKHIVVDPKRQFGQPIIAGTNIRAEIIFSLYNGGESKKDIESLYNISQKEISDAILFYQKAA